VTRADRPSPSDPAWTAWRNDAESALLDVSSAKTAKERSDAIKRHRDVYKQAREFWRGVFGGKCAYCESPHAASSRVDVEHFRPKGNVTDVKGTAVMRTIAGNPEPHPGYYWLTFEWSNLLPSCQECNRPKYAKSNRFPIANEDRRVYGPGPLTDEDPLILNPFEDNPDDHLNFNTPQGLVAAKNGSVKGQTTITVIHLNRDALRLARFLLYADIRRVAANVAVAKIDCDRTKLEELADELRVRHRPDWPYAALWRAKTSGVLREIEEYLRNNPA
jgi:uncharacterized protein (TIGR02646 family)